jgi:DNA-repair protein complementing XP-A cells
VEKPNPHKNTYNNMMLYMRYQVEEYAFKKWNGPDGLDTEYERRVQARKKRKDKKFLKKLKEMRRKTRAEALTRKDYSGPHNHQWGEPTDLQNGMVSRRCMTCGLTTEEISMG